MTPPLLGNPVPQRLRTFLRINLDTTYHTCGMSTAIRTEK
ncbi:hypothetical protein SDC9_165751 [bioreactor metagenome]|uniref:Uncharacterized protein n=1 Tax=bioreactor metagenome TaxID=1076179 RepID=A0A645FV48_9ZZZZ